MIKQCLDVIEKDQTIYRVEHIFPEIPFGKTWFYHHKLNEVNDIKNALELNRIKEKKRTANKLRDSKNILGLIAYFKLVADPDEYERINTQKLDHTSGGDKIQPLEITVAKQETTNKIKKLIDESMLN